MVASVLIVASEEWHGKHTLDHDLEGVQKFHTTAVPRIGGAAIITAVLATLFVVSPYVGDLITAAHFKAAVFLVVAALPTFLAGIIEDMTKRVSVKARLLAAMLSALLACWLLGASVQRLDIWGIDSLLVWAPFALAVTAIVVAGGINAINIIDGFNGLAGSVVVVMLGAFGVIALQVDDKLVAELAGVGLGAALGFLCVNFPKGRLFLGDGGAYFLGFWVAEVALLLLVRNPGVNAWQILCVCSYPVIEVLYSMYRRKIVRQSSPGAPDGLHLHTLLYRRVTRNFVTADAAKPWKRNAAVAVLVLPCVLVGAFAGVFVGATVSAGVAIVLAQLVAYLIIYARLVRGRWVNPFGSRLAGSGVVREDQKEVARIG
jgi:UDP-N-acetylmuramyl pentapeptide phosphotransferase/UDP-N-acetylglucosamine-1-phosphate transferase